MANERSRLVELRGQLAVAQIYKDFAAVEAIVREIQLTVAGCAAGRQFQPEAPTWNGEQRGNVFAKPFTKEQVDSPEFDNKK